MRISRGVTKGRCDSATAAVHTTRALITAGPNEWQAQYVRILRESTAGAQG